MGHVAFAAKASHQTDDDLFCHRHPAFIFLVRPGPSSGRLPHPARTTNGADPLRDPRKLFLRHRRRLFVLEVRSGVSNVRAHAVSRGVSDGELRGRVLLSETNAWITFGDSFYIAS